MNGMEFENTFSVEAPIEEVWKLLLDVERIAPCMPGAQVLERAADDAYKVAIKVKLGPMTMNYKGDVEIIDKDPATHAATMKARAREARGQGTAQANMRMSLQGENGTTHASIITDLQMSGRAAAMGRGVVRDVAASLTDTFARNLAEMVRAGGAPAAGPATAQPPAPEAPPAAAPPLGPEAQQAPPPPHHLKDDALRAEKVVAAVVAGRLRDPRTVGGLMILMLIVGYLLGRRGR
jgi:carbon monoxide dehydrogenase subunit G